MPHATESPPPAAGAQPSLDGKYLYTNDGIFLPDEVAPLRPSYPDEPLEELRARYDRDGFIFLKGVIPRGDVLKAREAYFRGVAHSKALKPDSEPVEGIFDPANKPRDYPGIGAGQKEEGSSSNGKPTGTNPCTDLFVEAALAQHTAPWYWNEDGTGFAQHPKLKEFIAYFTGWGDKTQPVKRTLLRNNTPGNNAIGVHYDQIFMRYGEPTNVTAWVPIGDVSLEGGGLIYLEGGEKIGEVIEQDFEKKAKESGMSEEEMKYAFNKNMMTTGFLSDGPRDFAHKYGGKWFAAAYEAGDVTLHKAHAVRKWLRCRSRGRTTTANGNVYADPRIDDQP